MRNLHSGHQDYNLSSVKMQRGPSTNKGQVCDKDSLFEGSFSNQCVHGCCYRSIFTCDSESANLASVFADEAPALSAMDGSAGVPHLGCWWLCELGVCEAGLDLVSVCASSCSRVQNPSSFTRPTGQWRNFAPLKATLNAFPSKATPSWDAPSAANALTMVNCDFSRSFRCPVICTIVACGTCP